jgi:glyoxylase-like metal-dependent hydrolase (beta-lactamase superfamily II)
LSPLALEIDCIVSEPFAENTYLVRLAEKRDCLIVDPGFEPDRVLEEIAQKSLKPAAILNTHGHSDHIAGNRAMKEQWPNCPLVIGAEEAAKLTDPALNLSAPFGLQLISPPADLLVREGDTLEFAGIELAVRETPGHSCGHVIYLWRGGSPWIVFGGDVLFRAGVGRTDFPDGSSRQLAASIREKLYSLPGDTIVLPGHGDATTIDYERQFNPFVR